MARQAKRTAGLKVDELVAVAQTKDEEEARDYQLLLGNDNIPASVEAKTDSETGDELFSVLVPEHYVDEAYVVIESQDAYDDFYDQAIDDEDDFVVDVDLLDEEF